jgi:hypothetical protein
MFHIDNVTKKAKLLKNHESCCYTNKISAKLWKENKTKTMLLQTRIANTEHEVIYTPQNITDDCCNRNIMEHGDNKQSASFAHLMTY